MKNRYGISPKYWKRLGVTGRKMFRNIYSQAKQDWINPNGKMIPKKDWDTIRHNFAFLAAAELIVK